MAYRLKVGLVGCGGIALEKHIPALKQLPDVEMVAFCDLIEERAVRAAREHGSPNAFSGTDYRDLINNPDIDIIYVLTPNNSHCRITVDALNSGKHVLCEKPMAITSAEAKLMLEAANRSGKKLTIGYQNRFRQDCQYLKKACLRGDLGEIYYARAHAVRRRAVPTWGVFLDEDKQGGGPLIDIGCHSLDLTLWMMDNYSPRMVLGTAYKKLAQNGDCGNIFGSWKPENFRVEDAAFGFIVMENGATIYLESSWALNTLDVAEAKTSLSGTKAGADMRDGLRISGDEFGKLYVKSPDLSYSRGVDYYTDVIAQPALLEARTWINAIKHDEDVCTKPEEALVVTQILEAIYQSAQSGQPIFF